MKGRPGRRVVLSCGRSVASEADSAEAHVLELKSLCADDDVGSIKSERVFPHRIHRISLSQPWQGSSTHRRTRTGAVRLNLLDFWLYCMLLI